MVSAHRHRGPPDRAAEWLLVEWPEDRAEPTRYWLSTLPEDIPFERLVALTKLRWRIERDYQDLKQEFGLDHFEGRSWRGFHHHATLCITAYGFLISERETIPPSAPRADGQGACPAVSRRSRGFSCCVRPTCQAMMMNHDRCSSLTRCGCVPILNPVGYAEPKEGGR